MARENTVLLHGQIVETPKIYVSNEGKNLQAAFNIKCMRRPFVAGEGQSTMGKLRIDFPSIISRDPDLIQYCATLAKGDIVDIKGVLTTKNCQKTTYCPYCPDKHPLVAIGTHVFVTPIYICRREVELSEEKGEMLLRDRTEISNNVIVIGALCKDLMFYEFDPSDSDTHGHCISQYQLAVNRRFHIKDRPDEERVDYPWVKTIDRQAREDKERLTVGSLVEINGALQTRNITRTLVCPKCGKEFEKKELVSELFPYAVEYLARCNFGNEDTPTKIEKEETK